VGESRASRVAARFTVASRPVTPLHPIFVHFPIALLVTAAAIDLAMLGVNPKATLRSVSTGLYLVGSVALIVTYVTGRSDAEEFRIPGMAHSVLDEHWTSALRTTVFFNVFAVVRFVLEWSERLVSRLRWLPVIVAGMVGLLFLVQTAERGGQLVYNYGVGVAVPR